MNVDFDVFRIRTAITEGGSTIEAGYVDDSSATARPATSALGEARRGPHLRRDASSTAKVVARTRSAPSSGPSDDRGCSDRRSSPAAAHIPKTLIFAKDDSTPRTSSQIVREEFGKGNDVSPKITYKSSDGASPRSCSQAFRTSYNPRIAVTVDMIATGTDVKPIEMRGVHAHGRSRHFFEQMKGRGVRIIADTDLQAVTPDADGEGPLRARRRGRRHRDQAHRDHPARTQAERVAREAAPPGRARRARGPRLDPRLPPRPHRPALAPDRARRARRARRRQSLKRDRARPRRGHRPRPPARAAPRRRRARASPTTTSIAAAAKAAARGGGAPLAANPELRERSSTSPPARPGDRRDQPTTLLEAEFSSTTTDRARRPSSRSRRSSTSTTTRSPRSRCSTAAPYAQRLTFRDVKELAEAIGRHRTAGRPSGCGRPTRRSTARRSAAPGERVLTNIVSLVRVHPGRGRRARAVPRAGRRALRGLAAPAAERRPHVHGRAARVAPPHPRPPRGVAVDRRSRTSTTRRSPGGRAREGGCRCSATTSGRCSTS